MANAHSASHSIRLETTNYNSYFSFDKNLSSRQKFEFWKTMVSFMCRDIKVCERVVRSPSENRTNNH